MITVRDLFFNTPARRKFMKTVATEMAHIGDGLASLALGHPPIHFDLRHDGRSLRRWPPATDPAERVAAVLGASLRSDLLPLALTTEAVTVSGWAAAPRVNRRTARGIHIFVNGRPVRDRTVRHAILHGYRQRLMKGQYPVAVCYLSVPVAEVDVNVHPAKYEVRFVRQQAVHGAVAGAVHAALTAGERPPGSAPPAVLDRQATAPPSPGLAESRAPFNRRRSWRDATSPLSGRGMGPASTPSPSPPLPQAALWPGGGFARLNVIGQLGNTYIVCASEDGLVLIDQHAAHERIYYEQLQKRDGMQNAASQPLLIPETLELDFREATALGAIQETLGRLGVAIEPFGGNTFIIRAAPDFLAQVELGPMIREIIERAAAAGVKPDPQALGEASLQIMACHGAIRARQRLDPRQMQRLLVQLEECDNPSHCPHGRPTWIRWTLRELEKAFGRRV